MTMDDSTQEQPTLKNLENALGYRFKSAEQLTAALRHSSFVNEQPQAGISSNERLEFLGDAVLNLAISHLLMKRYPDQAEGELSRNRAHLVNETQLASIAREIGLGPHLLLGKGEAVNQPVMFPAFWCVSVGCLLNSLK